MLVHVLLQAVDAPVLSVHVHHAKAVVLGGHLVGGLQTQLLHQFVADQRCMVVLSRPRKQGRILRAPGAEQVAVRQRSVSIAAPKVEADIFLHHVRRGGKAFQPQTAGLLKKLFSVGVQGHHSRKFFHAGAFPVHTGPRALIIRTEAEDREAVVLVEEILERDYPAGQGAFLHAYGTEDAGFFQGNGPGIHGGINRGHVAVGSVVDLPRSAELHCDGIYIFIDATGQRCLRRERYPSKAVPIFFAHAGNSEIKPAAFPVHSSVAAACRQVLDLRIVQQPFLPVTEPEPLPLHRKGQLCADVVGPGLQLLFRKLQLFPVAVLVGEIVV